MNGTIVESTQTLQAFPYWWLEKADVVKLSPGQTRAFSVESGYSLKNMWLLYHVEDTNPSNNGFPGPGGVFLGKEFLPNGSMTGKSCKE